jgi:hypothetical protein
MIMIFDRFSASPSANDCVRDVTPPLTPAILRNGSGLWSRGPLTP